MTDGPAATPPAPPGTAPGGAAARPGTRIITVSRVGTAVFTVTAVLAVVDRDRFGVVAVAVDLALFFVGCVVFLWAFAIAVGRSRTDAIGIGGLYFLAGTAPKRVQRALMVPFGAQIVVALVTAGLRPFTSLAFGVLVPMFGLAQAGLWGARYGTFGPRFDEAPPTAPKAAAGAGPEPAEGRDDHPGTDTPPAGDDGDGPGQEPSGPAPSH